MLLTALAATLTIAAGCSREESSAPVQTPRPMMSKTPFERTPDDQTVDLITLRNRNGIEMQVLSYGGIIMSLKTPDRTGAIDDIVLGFDHVKDYVEKSPYFGTLIGRYGNRIAKGKFTLDGQTYTLATNNNANHLHGGVKGWDKVVWTADLFQNADGVGVDPHVHEQGRRGRLSRHGQGARHVHAQRTGRADRRLPRDHRQADGDQPDAAQLFQSGRHEGERHPGPRADAERRVSTRPWMPV